ncbi:hypothetical protein ACHAP7_011379 [Fusarium lateritium]
MIEKTIRKIDVVVVPEAHTSGSTKTVGKTTTTRAGLVLTKLPSGSLVKIAQVRGFFTTKLQTKAVDVPVTESATEIERVTSIQNSGTTNIPVSSGFTLIKNDTSYIAQRRHKVRAAAKTLALDAILKMRVDCVKKVPSLSTRYIATSMQGARRTLKA